MVTKFNHNNVKSQFSCTLIAGLIVYITKVLKGLKSLKNKFYENRYKSTLKLNFDRMIVIHRLNFCFILNILIFIAFFID